MKTRQMQTMIMYGIMPAKIFQRHVLCETPLQIEGRHRRPRHRNAACRFTATMAAERIGSTLKWVSKGK